MPPFNVLWTIFNLTHNFIYVHSKLGPYWAIWDQKILFPPKPTVPAKSRVSAIGGTACLRVPHIKGTA